MISVAELDEIFRLNTTARIACVDLSQKMLEILRIKHEDRLDSLNLITGSYFEVDLPSEEFDIAISVQSMHHFGYKQKLSLKKILHSLAGNGTYIEADYVVDTTIEEMGLRKKCESLSSEHDAPDGFYHFDLSLSVDNQQAVLEEAVFSTVRHHARYENSSIFVSRKPTSKRR